MIVSMVGFHIESPHRDREISQGRKEAFRRIFHDRASLDKVEGFIEFSIDVGRFGVYDVLKDRGLRSSIYGGQLMG